MGGFFGAIGGPGDGRRAGTNTVMRGAGAGKIGGVANCRLFAALGVLDGKVISLCTRRSRSSSVFSMSSKPKPRSARSST
jgi:hypothetical protein